MVLPINSANGLEAEAAAQTLRQKGIQFWLENGTLRYTARKGVVTAADVASLRQIATLYSQVVDNSRDLDIEQRAVKRPSQGPLPLAFSQLHHWNMRAWSGHRPIRQIASATRLRGSLNERVLRE